MLTLTLLNWACITLIGNFPPWACAPAPLLCYFLSFPILFLLLVVFGAGTLAHSLLAHIYSSYSKHPIPLSPFIYFINYFNCLNKYLVIKINISKLSNLDPKLSVFFKNSSSFNQFKINANQTFIHIKCIF